MEDIIKVVNERIEDKQLYLKYDNYKNFNKTNLINYIVSLIKDKTISFPYKKYFAGNPKLIFRKIVDHNMEYDKIIAPSFNNERYFKSDNNGTMITTDQEYSFDLLSDIFQEKARLTAHKKNKISPLEDWPISSFKVLSSIIQNRANINPENLREYLYSINGNYLECTQFKPTIAKEIYTRFKSRNVLDLSSGWGDRLIGAIACDSVQSYLGFDPNTGLRKGHSKIINTLCPLNGKNPENFKVDYVGFEYGDLTNKSFDMMFTSPPFFDFEVYSNDDQQSINTNPNFKSWIKNFLFESIDKCWDHLEESGKLIIYIGDTPGSNPTIPMNIHIDQYPDSKFLGSTCFASFSHNKMGRRRYVWMWEKKSNLRKRDMSYMMKDYPEIFSK